MEINNYTRRIKHWWPYFLFLAILAGYVLLLTHGELWYGSSLDWNSQHYRIPEYLRTLFYSTGDLLPSFDINTGAGQSIYNLSYYGLLSPVILFSYALPFISMRTYVISVSIISVAMSVIIMYRWISKHYSMKVAIVAALLFELSVPLLFHSHRHVMYIIYMPFLLLAMRGAERYIEGKGPWVLILCTFLTIMSNWFFSFSGLFAIGIMAVWAYLRHYKGTSIVPMHMICTGLRVAGCMFVSALMSSVLLLPLVQILAVNRKATTGEFTVKDLIIPYIHSSQFLYSISSLGLTSIIIAAIAYGLISKKTHIVFGSVVLGLICMFGGLLFVLNGAMYIDGKVLIPFIPLAIFVIAQLLTDAIDITFNRRKFIIAFGIGVILALIGYIIEGAYDRIPIFVIDSVLTCSFIVAMKSERARYFCMAGIVLIAMIVCFYSGMEDELEQAGGTVDNSFQIQQNLVEEAQNVDDGFYRVSNNAGGMRGLNHVFNSEYMSATMYSSLENKYFNQFFFEGIYNEVRCRNGAIIHPVNNIFYNIFMGNKYAISNTDYMAGYETILKDEGVNLMINKDARPLAYTTYKTLDQSVYAKLNDEDKVEALMEYAVVPSGGHKFVSHVQSIEAEVLDDLAEQVNGVTNNENVCHVRLDSPAEASIRIPGIKANDIVMVSFDIDNSDDTSATDTEISINGIDNKLTSLDWKYSNNNKRFHYAIYEGVALDKLKIVLGKGYYNIRNFKISTLDYQYISNYSGELTAMNIDKANTGGSRITGNITSPYSGCFIATIPYDENFVIEVDGKETNYFRANGAFIGFELDSGQHRIDIVYRNRMQQFGMVMTIAGFLIFGLVILISWFRRKYNE